MLPTSHSSSHPIGPSRRKRHSHGGSSREDAPWGLLVVLLVSCSVLAITRQRSLAEEAANPELLRDGGFDEHEPTVMRKDLEMSEAARSVFNPDVHAMYKALPALPDPTAAVLSGGWELTPAVYDYAANQPSAEVLSLSSPRLVLFRSFLSPEEVGHLVAVAKDHMERSQVLTANESDAVDNARTSFGAWPPRDHVLDAINDRIHRLVRIPREFGEDIYVLNYKLGQRYDAHNDHCMDTINGDRTADESCKSFLARAGGPECGPEKGGPSCGDRVATVILFLKSPAQGGHTVFPHAAMTGDRMRAAGKEQVMGGNDAWYCENDGEVLGASPGPGDAVLFWDYAPGSGAGTGSFEDGSAEPQATPVPTALHSGCPVLEGQKWIATRWIRGAQFT